MSPIMEKPSKKIKTILLVILFIILLAGIAYWMIVGHSLPWWLAVSVDSGILALVLAVLAFRSYMIRKKENQFINRLIEQDNARLPLGSDARRQQIVDLQSNWKESRHRLQNSALRQKGNPLYVLPWYVIIGETGSGKTSAILNSGTYTSLTDHAPAREIDTTRNCDWYFFENAIILDTAGRYAVPLNDAFDLDEWRNFLVLLTQCRKKEPINGLVIAVAADTLLFDNEERLQEKSKIIRQRINHMMRSLGTKFPVYVLITKMDKVPGFDDFSRKLTVKELEEAMGFMNNANILFWHDVFTDATQVIGNRLHHLSRLLALKSEKVSSQLIFPVEFNTLSEKLELFLEPLFADNSYQVTPPFRGIFYSSTISRNDSAEDKHPVKSIFLNDFFSRILPEDRIRYTFLEEFNLWKRITKSLALSSWLLLILLIGGLMGYSYLGNLAVINRFSDVFNTLLLFTGDINNDLIIMERFRQEIVDLENQNKTLHIPMPVGFGKRGAIEKQAKLYYCLRFEDKFVTPLDDSLRNVSSSQKDKADITGYLVLRILSLKDTALSLNNVNFIPLASGVMQLVYHVQQEYADLYGQNYNSYMAWNKQARNETELSATKRVFREKLQNRLIAQLSDETNINMAWLLYLNNLDNDDMRISTFWSDYAGPKSRDSVILQGAYTQHGRQEIHDFLFQLRQALDDEQPDNRSDADVQIEILDSRTDEFLKWYQNNFFNAWYHAIMATENGASLFRTLDEKRINAISMTTSDNPYFRMLDVSSREIIAYGNASHRPLWVSPLLYAARLRSLSKAAEESASQKNKGISSASFRLLFAKQPGKAFADTLAAAQGWTRYLNALKTLPVSSMNSRQMADAYAACFSYPDNNVDPTKSPFLNSYASADSLANVLNLTPEQTENPEPVSILLFGPLNYLLAYAGDLTGDYLQKTWLQTAVAESSHLNPAKKAYQLFDKKEGLVWKFVKGPASPFLCNTEEGYLPLADMMGNAIQFRDDFLYFLDNGSILPRNLQPHYAVTFRTIPVRVNSEARVQPVSVRLDVASTETPFVLNNFNYPQTAVFRWNPDTCGTTILTIAFPGFTVQKIYSDTFGFARFLNDFRDGKHVFSRDDFPDKKAWLASNNINAITVAYQIDGKAPVLQLLNTVPDEIPTTIIDGLEN